MVTEFAVSFAISIPSNIILGENAAKIKFIYKGVFFNIAVLLNRSLFTKSTIKKKGFLS